MGYSILEESIEIEPSSLKKYNQNIHTLHVLSISLNNALEDSKHFVNQVESFMASSISLANDLHKIGLQFPDIGVLSTSMSSLNKEINQLLPQSLRECKLLLEYSLDNQISNDNTETFKNLKQEVDKYLVDATQYRRDLRTLLIKYAKSPSDSTSDKISSTMAKLSQSINQYEKYLNLLDSELTEYCSSRHKYLLNLSKNILNLHHLVHFGRNMNEVDVNKKSTIPTTSTGSGKSDQIGQQQTFLVPPANFKEIVDNAIFLKAFRIFAEKQHCLENLLFWLDANTLKDMEASKEYPKEKIVGLFLSIYNNYIAPDCAFEINIDSESKNILEKGKAKLKDLELIYPSMSMAVESIYSNLNFSMFPVFLKSPLYHAAVIMNKCAFMSEPVDGGRGIAHSISSFDQLLHNPIAIEYFLMYVRQQAGGVSSSSSSLSPSQSLNNLSSISSSSSTPSSPRGNAPMSSMLTPPLSSGSSSPLTLQLSPRLSPLISPFSPQNVTNNEIELMVYFLLEIKKFKEMSEDNLESYAIEIYDLYLKPGAEKQIYSISNMIIQEKISSKSISHDLFDGISQDITLHITNGSFSTFINSPFCKEMLGREEKMKKYMEKEKDKKKSENRVDLQFEQIAKEKLKIILPKSPFSKNQPSNIPTKPLPPPPTVGNSSSNLSSSTGSSSSATATGNNNAGNTSPQLSERDRQKNFNVVSNNSQYAHSNYPPPIVSISASPPNNNLSTGGGYQSLTSSTNSNSSAGSSNDNTSRKLKDSKEDEPMLVAKLAHNLISIGSKSKSHSRESSDSHHGVSNTPNDALAYILGEPVWRDSFKKFVKLEKSEELLLCWMELESFKSKPSHKSATSIYETFVRDGAPLEVNLESDTRSMIKQSLTKSDDYIEEQFKLVTQEVWELLRVDSFARFSKSLIYRDMVNQYGDPQDPKNRKSSKKYK
eukprot:gene5926-7378_t